MQFFFKSERKDKIETGDHTYNITNQTIVEYSFHDKGINTLHSKQILEYFLLDFGRVITFFFTYFGHFCFFRQWVGQDSTKLVHF